MLLKDGSLKTFLNRSGSWTNEGLSALFTPAREQSLGMTNGFFAISSFCLRKLLCKFEAYQLVPFSRLLSPFGL
jgi:hypothetical protein